MSDFFQDVFNKTKKFANDAVDETKDAAQKAKLNNKISNEVQMIDRNMVEIGKYFYELNKGNPPQELLQYFNNVKVLKDSTATGYQVQYSKNSAFKGTKTVTFAGVKNTSLTFKTAGAGTKYFVRVRSYKKVGNTVYYGAWSSSISVVTEKY